MELIEIEVHQAMAVMDEETGQLLNYRKLLRSTKYNYNKQWSISSANELRWLANGVGNRIKNPTNKINAFAKTTSPRIAGNMSHMDPSCAACDQKRRRRTGQDSQWVVIAYIILTQ